MVRPLIDRADVLGMLNGLYDSAVEELAPVGTGQISRAFSFRVGAEEYVVRFVDDTMATSFGKDEFISRTLASTRIPVPAVVMRGTHGDLHYAISRKLPGVQSDDISVEEFERLVPS